MDTQAVVRNVRENPEFAREAQDQYQALLARSATDMEFRRKLLTDARSAVAEFSGHSIPESFNIVFVENKVDATIVLPDAVDPAMELSESELETVAGGVTPTIIVASLLWSAVASLSAYVIGHETA